MWRRNLLIVIYLFVYALGCTLLTQPILAQPKGPKVPRNNPDNPKGPKVPGGSPDNPKGPKIGKAEENTTLEQGRIIYVPKIQYVPVPSDKGYLTLFTVPDAKIILKPINGTKETGKAPTTGTANKAGLVTIRDLIPGNYQLEIICKDYLPLSDKVTIDKGRPTVRLAPLSSMFATLRIGLGNQASDDITVKLNGKPIDKPKIEQKELVFEHVPVGKQTFTFSKPGFRDWTQEFEIRSGNNSFSETMEVATIAVTIKTQPRAEIYVDNDAKREASESGELTLSLPPGARKLRVELSGYEAAERELKLAPEPRAVTLPVPLTPIADDADFEEPFNPRLKTWTPFLPAGWRVQTTKPLGLQMTGEAPAFVSSTTLPNRRFNIYRDFDLLLNVRLTKGKGVAWIVRARDEKNCYLFELDREQKKLSFYLYQNGERREIKVADTVVSFDDKERFYRITLEARGGKFFHTIETPDGPKPLGVVFEDNTFGYGGIGLRAFNGAEVFINQFSILKPQNKTTGAVR